jgi:hypothetical protein
VVHGGPYVPPPGHPYGHQPQAYGPPHPPIYQPPQPPDEADIFAASLPTAGLKVGTIFVLLQGLLMIPYALRISLSDLYQTDLVMALEVGHVLLAVLCFACVKMLSGKLWAGILAICISPLCGLASIFALATGAFAGGFGMFVSLITLVLAAANLGAMSRMTRAKKTLEAMSA